MQQGRAREKGLRAIGASKKDDLKAQKARSQLRLSKTRNCSGRRENSVKEGRTGEKMKLAPINNGA